ncbi:DUF309 domain-containing protein [Cytobacillus massiliigabonensis]|uniref:DUF309 domain-containing protein n=1 Tax=Cytobacillus massiliigabonensis TaxID=1871011 RepID=UPI000C857B31|nr:DUF309 domain-containing protein [Cytobacillus massiliigabonensis]
MYPEAYIEYLIHFHGDRDYFECHEILEEYWKEVDPNNKQSIWVGLILLAVSNYHHRRENFLGAKKTMTKAISILKNEKNRLLHLGIDAEKLINDLLARQKALSLGNPYTSYTIPIIDSILISNCKSGCIERGFTWDSVSDLHNKRLVHRHSTRDRSNVIQERLDALNKNTRFIQPQTEKGSE